MSKYDFKIMKPGIISTNFTNTYEQLDVWVTMDIQTSYYLCLDALAMVSDVAAGKFREKQWEGEMCDISITKDKVVVQNNFVDDETTEIQFDLFKDILEEYWKFLTKIPPPYYVSREYRPDLPEIWADLLDWEETWQRKHPYRGRIGIPADGPK